MYIYVYKIKEVFMDFKKMSAIAAMLLLAACGDDSSSSAPDDSGKEGASIDISKMTLREKVGQMFFVRPEALDTSIHWNEYAELPDYKLQKVNETMLAINKDYPIGGMILYAHNIVDESQLEAFIAEIRKLNGSPFLAIDEEGGRVARIKEEITSLLAFHVTVFLLFAPVVANNGVVTVANFLDFALDDARLLFG